MSLLFGTYNNEFHSKNNVEIESKNKKLDLLYF
jgi:hypothetical protein